MCIRILMRPVSLSRLRFLWNRIVYRYYGIYKQNSGFHVKEPSVISFGKFDGLHRGHEFLMEKQISASPWTSSICNRKQDCREGSDRGYERTDRRTGDYQRWTQKASADILEQIILEKTSGAYRYRRCCYEKNYDQCLSL